MHRLLHSRPAAQLPTLLCLLSACLLATAAVAQPLTKSRVVDMLRVAEQELAADRPYSALEWFQNAYEETKDRELAYRIGMLNYELRDYTKANSYLERAMRRNTDDAKVDAYFYIGRSLKMQGLYGEAIENFKEFRRQAPKHPLVAMADIEIAGAQMALTMTEPPRIKVTNAGRMVNTSNQEYSPVIAPGGELYYAGFGKSGLISEAGEESADIRIFSSVAEQGGEYRKGSPLPKNINREGSQTVNVALDAKGERMLIVRSELDGRRQASSKIYLSTKTGSAWGPANELGFLNGDYFAKNPAFGELFGKPVVFFASDMEGGLGGFDLYYAAEEGGGYARPVNLGKVINSPYDDVTPYYRDGTLYFSTEGRPTLGGFDIFRAEWSGDAWSEPANMGKGFNSSYDDRYFQLDGSGKRGVLTSNRPPTRSVKSKTCCDDIFVLNVEPILVELLALTLDGDGGLLPGVTLDLLEVTDGDTTVLSRKLNPKGNRFDFALVDDVNYVLIARLPGYAVASTEFNTLGVTEPTTLQRTLVLQQEKGARSDGEETIELTLNQPIRLANIYYDYDDDKILPAAKPDLDYIEGIMNDYPAMVVELGSHTDARGKDAYNLDLSQRRAQRAVDYLVAKGLDRSRLRAQGYGETQILNKCANNVNCTDEEHRFNRRTEFKIIEGPTTIEVKRQRRTGSTEPQALPRGSGKQSVGEQKAYGAVRDTTPPPSDLKALVDGDMSSLFYEKDLTGAPILAFDQREVAFGKVAKGDKREHRYTFKNVGRVPASIAIVSACECTTLDWTLGEIAPGASGFVNAVFDSSEKDAGEMITIDIILDQQAASGNGIVEQVLYTFEMTQ